METEYSVTVQKVNGIIIRFHPSQDAIFKDPYFGTTFVESDWGMFWWRWWTFRRALAHVFAVTVEGKISTRQFIKMNREVERKLYDIGYRWMYYERSVLCDRTEDDDNKPRKRELKRRDKPLTRYEKNKSP